MIHQLSIATVLWVGACAAAQDTTPALGQVVDSVDPRIWRIHQDQAGHYWLGSNGNGVYRYDGEIITHYLPSDGLSGVQVRDIQEDGDGNVFVSTTRGVSKFDGTSFETLEIVQAAPGEGWVLNPNDVWLVVDPVRGPCRYDGERLYELQLSKSPVEDAWRAANPGVTFAPTDLYSIHRDRRGHLWFGTACAGLCRYDGKTLSWMYEETLTTTPSGGGFGIRCIFEDRSGDFWICNTRQRFAMASEPVDQSGFSRLQYEAKDGLPDSSSDEDANFTFYPSMLEDADGTFWMACGSDGVLKFDGEEVTHFPIGDEAYVVTILQDRAGKLWVGTVEQGVYVLAGTSFERTLNG